MENKYSVYIHIFTNKKVYIGITSRKPEIRWGCKGNNYTAGRMKNAIKKYGWENVEHYILEKNITKEQAEELEMKLIKLHRSNEKEFGYNSSIGGENGCSGYKYSDELRQKMKYNWKENYSNRPKNHSQETKDKIGKSLKGRRVWNKGIKGIVKQPQSFYDKRSKTMKEKYPNGHKTSPIHYVLQMDLDNNIIAIWDNVISAEKGLGIKDVWKCCNFKCKTTKGFKFKYAEDFDKQYKRNWKVIL